MKKLIQSLKALALFGALSLVGLSATPGASEAGTFCEDPGHTCHAQVGGTTHHLKEAPAY